MLGRSTWSRAFYLAGGTGLALQLGHRRSHDLDLFTVGPAEKLASGAIIHNATSEFGAGRARVTLRQVDQVELTIDDVRTTFVAYPFALRFPVVRWDGLAVADVRDIALMKAYALGRRAVARDYCDLYWVLKTGAMTLEQVVRMSEQKFVVNGANVFNARLLMGQLTYTDDVPTVDAPVEWIGEDAPTFAEVADYLREAVRAYARSEFGDGS